MSSARDAAQRFAQDLLATHQPLTQPGDVCVCHPPPQHRRPAILCSCGSYYSMCDVARAGLSVELLPSPGRTDPPDDPLQGRPLEPSERQLSAIARRVLGNHHAVRDEFPSCGRCGRGQYQRTYCICTAFAARCGYARLARAHGLQPPLPEERPTQP